MNQTIPPAEPALQPPAASRPLAPQSPAPKLPAAAQMPPQPETPTVPPRNRSCLESLIWRDRPGEAFWTISGLVSLAVNLILLAVVVVLGRELFALKNLVENQLVDGLYQNFVKMDQAHIVSSIQVSDTLVVKDTIPVVFDLPLNQTTTVVLTKDTPVRNAIVYLNGAAVTTNITLRKGTPLSIALNLVVPVNQMLPVELKVPVNLTVPVDIALEKTDLHEPFAGLQEVVAPYRSMLGELPSSADELPCGLFKPLCSWYFK